VTDERRCFDCGRSKWTNRLFYTRHRPFCFDCYARRKGKSPEEYFMTKMSQEEFTKLMDGRDVTKHYKFNLLGAKDSL
jgi:hypothetical protein